MAGWGMPMPRFQTGDVVRVNLPGVQIHGGEGTVLASELRDDQWYYEVELPGQDCSWMLPERALHPTGRSAFQGQTRDGAKYHVGDMVELRPVRRMKADFTGQAGQIVGKVHEEDAWWYTVTLQSGEVVVVREDELVFPRS